MGHQPGTPDGTNRGLPAGVPWNFLLAHGEKNGTIWHFFRASFPSTWRTLSPDALFTRIWGTRKHLESATLSCFPCYYPGAFSPPMPIFHGNRETAKSSRLCPPTFPAIYLENRQKKGVVLPALAGCSRDIRPSSFQKLYVCFSLCTSSAP